MTGDQPRVIRGRVDIQGLQLLESDSLTFFDRATLLFRRLQYYYRREIDAPRSWFMVALDEAGRRLLRARPHADPAGRDGGR